MTKFGWLDLKTSPITAFDLLFAWCPWYTLNFLMVHLHFYNYIVYHIHVKTLSGINFGGWNPETGVPREGAERVMKAQAGA